MRKIIALIFMAFSLSLVAQSADTSLIPADTPWKRAVVDFAKAHLKHSAWGVTHSERDYLLGMDIAKHAGLAVDEEVMFAAAYLHDMGGFEEFKKPGVDHAVRSAELVGGVLESTGFPMAKLEKVKQAILAHTYYNPVPPKSPEEIALHDADVIDFLGVLGIARILSITERDPVAPTLAGGLKVLEQLCRDLPSRLFTDYSSELGKKRGEEMKHALEALRAESFDAKAL